MRNPIPPNGNNPNNPNPNSASNGSFNNFIEQQQQNFVPQPQQQQQQPQAPLQHHHHPVNNAHYQQHHPQQQHPHHHQHHNYYTVPPQHPQQQHVSPHGPRMSSDEKPLNRTDTEHPLTSEEYEQLQLTLGQQGVQPNASTFTRMLDEGAGPSTMSTSWLQQTNHFQAGSEVAAGSNDLQRGDTLERIPHCINPSEMTDGPLVNTPQKRPHHEVKVEHSPAAAAIAAPQKNIIFNPDDNTVMIVENATLDEGWMDPQTPAVMPSPTGVNPTDKSFKGELGFSMEIMKLSKNAKNKDWDYSPDLRKLYIDIDKYVQIAFRLSDPNNIPEGLYIRALPVFALPGSLREVVKRCPNHASPSDSYNRNFNSEFLHHLIRANNDAAEYQEDADSHRLSIVIPFSQPQVGTDYCSSLFKFMCLGSDVGGINRRPLKVIFTLEDANANVFGRDVIDVRICSCPKRDCAQEMKKFQEDRDKAMGLATGLARSNSVFTKPSAKKRRMEVEEFVMVPVAKADFEKFNEMAEATVIMRNMQHQNQIKEQRKKLLEMHNKKYLNKPKGS